MSRLHIADTGLFVAMGRPSNSRYQAVRRFARRNGVTFVLHERVYEELTVDESDVEAPPVDTAIDDGCEVRRLASAFEVSDTVRDQACQLFRSAQNEDLLCGRSIEAIAAASVYGAYRCNGRSRLVDDVSEMARVAESRVTNAYKTLNEELCLPAEPSRSRPRSAASRRASIRPGSPQPPLQGRSRRGAMVDAVRGC